MKAVPRTGTTAAEVTPKVLAENITIQLQGSVNAGPQLDLSLTGVGPVFQADVLTGDEHTILSHQYSVKPQEGRYRVEYHIGLRVRFESSRNGNTTNYEYRDVSMTGTILAKEAEKVVISKDADRELSLTLKKVK